MNIRKLLNREGGFTLLELLIVIVIIGILAVLIIPNLASGPQRARDAQRKSDLRNLKTALETYYNDNSAYPTSLAPLTAGSTPYIKILPVDPKTKASYTYTPTSGCDNVTTMCTTYTLTVTLENTNDKDAVGGVYTVNSAN